MTDPPSRAPLVALAGGLVLVAGVAGFAWWSLPAGPSRAPDAAAEAEIRAAFEGPPPEAEPPEAPPPEPAGPPLRLSDFPVTAPPPFGNEQLPSGWSWARLVRELGTGSDREVGAVAEALARQHLADVVVAAERASRIIGDAAIAAEKDAWHHSYLVSLRAWAGRLQADAAVVARQRR